MNQECVAVKSKLVEVEYPGTGRVSVARFYGDTENPLQESVAYIRNMGALDDAVLGSPALVIPNYMSSPSRSMPFSSYFSVCCPDDCESVLGHIEEAVGEPSAEPTRLLDIVSSTPSDTQEAPRNLSATLVTRLDEIAGRHQGRVPLHGRLFMQWLHHAYPRECPYPHVSGTVKPVTQDEWLDIHEDIDNAMVTDEERAAYSQMHTSSEASIDQLPWTDVEEQIAVHQTASSGQSSNLMRCAVMLVAVLSFALPLVRGSVALVEGQSGDREKVQLV